jgi:very-short-patch-repair endonuclease
MSKLVPQYPQKLDNSQFVSYFANCCKQLLQSEQTPEKTKTLENLISNYKRYSKEYNESSILLNSIIFWSHKIKYTDPSLWDMLESAAYSKLKDYDSRSLVTIASIFRSNKAFMEKVEDHTTQNMKKFDSRALSELANILDSDKFIMSLFNSKMLIVKNELDVLYFLKASNNQSVIASLEASFQEILPKITNTQAFCGILLEFTKKTNYLLSSKTINLIESLLLQSQIPINLKDIHHLLVLFNHVSLYSRTSQNFWKKFCDRIKVEMDKWPVGLTMEYFSREGFFIPSLYETLTKKWKNEVISKKNPIVFRTGFCALSNSIFMKKEIIDWSASQIINLSRLFSDFDALHIARALTIINFYPSYLWTPVLHKLKLINTTKIIPEAKSIFFHIYKSIEIDKPENWKSMLSELKNSHQEISSSYKQNISFTKSISQTLVANILSEFGYKFLENQHISNFYEVDLMIPSMMIIIEVLGKSYHFSQFSNTFYPKLLMKIRHLKKLEWKILLVGDKESAINQLPKAISLISAFKDPVAFTLFDNEIKIYET